MRITNLIIALYMATLSSSAFANETFGSATVSAVISIYDGDTFRANIVGWPAIIGERIPVRINGIDAPEMNGKCKPEMDLARRAKQLTVTLLRSAKVIELKNIQRDKYFRILADVVVDGKNLGNSLKDAGLAQSYSGGKKPSWCSQ